MIRNKPKKDIRVAFRVSDTFTDGRVLTLETEVLGIQNQYNSKVPDVDVKPKVLNISG